MCHIFTESDTQNLFFSLERDIISEKLLFAKEAACNLQVHNMCDEIFSKNYIGSEASKVIPFCVCHGVSQSSGSHINIYQLRDTLHWKKNGKCRNFSHVGAPRIPESLKLLEYHIIGEEGAVAASSA